MFKHLCTTKIIKTFNIADIIRSPRLKDTRNKNPHHSNSRTVYQSRVRVRDNRDIYYLIKKFKKLSEIFERR